VFSRVFPKDLVVLGGQGEVDEKSAKGWREVGEKS
jgi:hypothetical protein